MNRKGLFASSIMLMAVGALVNPVHPAEPASPAPDASTAAATQATKTVTLGESLSVGGIEWSITLPLRLVLSRHGRNVARPHYAPVSSASLIGTDNGAVVVKIPIGAGMVYGPDCKGSCATLYMIPEIDKDVLFVDGNSGGSACCAIVTAVSISHRKILDQLVVNSLRDHPARKVDGVFSFETDANPRDVETLMEDIDPDWNSTGYMPDVEVTYHFVNGKFVPALQAMVRLASDAMSRTGGGGKVIFHLTPGERYPVLGRTKDEVYLYWDKRGLVGYVPKSAVEIVYH